ncbi:hypothetical protein JJB99_32855 [Bradyrhizobium diazoefficiens]|uniref:hypothetical protein n=1 Tax=Bradyrhizobium diazoefficiens TaxID=1355477 RepID=UPI00190E568A|nr:hypothetical protein [Bradyrhizobium diazoefficiens]QQO14050.1 hypothetical protein JJB99_32855 [Bradyrhizobium diazoefficiens]
MGASPFLREVTTRPLATLFSVICVILFVLQMRGMKIDGYGISLLAMAALPWSLKALEVVADAVGQALVRANIKSFQIAGVKVEQIERKLDEQRRMLDDLILYSMAFHIYDKLKYLHLGALDAHGKYAEYRYVDDEPSIHDLRYLRDHGYLEHFQISDLVPGENLVGKLKVTEMGQRFVNLKEGRGIQIDDPATKR